MEQPQRLEAGQEATNGFGESSFTRIAETSAIALAEQAKAAVQARYVMAMQRPRVLSEAREKLLKDCKRPRFADVAIYNKPIGEGVEGPSIRLLEAAARALGNIYAESTAIYDDSQKRIIRVSVTDLEANLTYPKDVTIEKTIERSRQLPGRKIINVRKNSKGYDVFLLEATSDEILDKENALVSKAIRVCLQRVVPGDLLDEAIEQCYRTIRSENEKDLPAARTRMVEQFNDVGVTEEQLAEYFGHLVQDTTVGEMTKAKSVLNALKAHETTWQEVLDFARQQRRGAESAQASQSGPLDEPASSSVNDRMAAKAAAAQEKEPAREVEVEKPTSGPANGGQKKPSRFQE